MRYLGPELPEHMHAMLAAVAHGQASRNVIQGTGDDSGYASTPIAGWQTASDLEDQFTKYLLSGPQTTAMLHTTTAVTMVVGGVKENVMPPVATATVNFRLLHGDTVESVIERVRDIVDDDRVEVSKLGMSIDPPPVADAYGNEYRLIERTIRQTWDLPGLLVSPLLSIGGADAKWFAISIARNVYRFTAVRVESADDAARWHGVNERVLVSELPRTVTFFYQLIENTGLL